MNRAFVWAVVVGAMIVTGAFGAEKKKDNKPSKQEIAQAEKRVEAAKRESAKARDDSDEAMKKARGDTDAATKARAALMEAKQRDSEVFNRLTRDSEQGKAIHGAQQDADAARADMDSARDKVLGQLDGDASYKQASDLVAQARAALEQLRDSGAATPEQIAKAADQINDQDTALGKLRDAALAKDPQYSAAADRFKAASAKLASLQDAMESKIRDNPERQKAVAAVKAAQDRVNETERDSRTSQAAAARARDEYNRKAAAVRSAEDHLKDLRR
ncbi:MAG: hypothetical protein GC162_12130 [Planctomycetes bacterium]|nr:hypothetical protein [Planctomycetota bacterium]